VEQRRRRNPAEQELAELIKEQQQQPLQIADSQPQEQDDSDKPKLKKGQHSEPLPGGGYMIITNGFER